MEYAPRQASIQVRGVKLCNVYKILLSLLVYVNPKYKNKKIMYDVY